jgi:hypothetical protein
VNPDEFAIASGMTYQIIKGTDAAAGKYQALLDKSED